MTREEIVKKFEECVKEVNQELEHIKSSNFSEYVNQEVTAGWELYDALNDIFYDLFSSALRFRDLANECDKIDEL